MFYRLYRRAKNAEDGIGDLQAQVRSWDGVVTWVSTPRLGKFYGKPVRALMTWCDEMNVRWSVTERNDP